MDGTQDKRQDPSKGHGGQEHHRRPGDPAQPQPGKQSREQGRKSGRQEPSRREDDLLREEDLHDEGL
ncbi:MULTISPECIES: hypothetical protein [unclassified Streptomyces]|uniref:hypothetical protein n=1 Tax=unclassified Streptomyces TaxID=2593676 RepID=UPI00068A0F5F|nr:hypothetical protein [Streptomyces sp. NRRL F-2747]